MYLKFFLSKFFPALVGNAVTHRRLIFCPVGPDTFGSWLAEPFNKYSGFALVALLEVMLGINN